MMKERGFRPVLPEVFRLFDRLFDRCRGASAAPCGAGENEKAGGATWMRRVPRLLFGHSRPRSS
ncbi:MAG: hypothetical protein GXX81_05820 [Acidobacteria bacterium]|nr:hypothetical protein [Acidobacteriota bacterium]